ncbi:hypothetical protein T492DRAFT_910318 [Pavlovales sp. CCMP2436]|nr:hypothetical protein T492DRAFT_910318 [Pavlovales sp. CCMP2436]
MLRPDLLFCAQRTDRTHAARADLASSLRCWSLAAVTDRVCWPLPPGGERRRLLMAGVPMEWRLLVYAHRWLFPARGDAEKRAVTDTTALGLGALRELDRRDAREACRQDRILSLAILETQLEPLGLTATWLSTSALSIAQGWITEPLAIVAGELASTHAERLLERAGLAPLLALLRAAASAGLV